MAGYVGCSNMITGRMIIAALLPQLTKFEKLTGTEQVLKRNLLAGF